MNVPSKASEIKAAVAAAIAIVAELLGSVGVAVVIFAVCMALDYFTGSAAARAHGEWSSNIAREGLWHKAGEVAAVAVAALCDIAVKYVLSEPAAPLVGQVHYGGYLTIIVSVWYILTELGSVLENVAKLGAPVPEWLIKGVGRMKKKVDKQETEKLENAGLKDKESETEETEGD